MLPTAYQLPAAVFLVFGGALACFFGYRLFRIVLAVYGFILGALVGSSIAGPADPLHMLLAALIGGLVGALLLNLGYFVGVALIGAGAGALLLHLVWTRVATGDPHVVLVIVAAVIGAIAATVLQRYVIVGATAVGGAWTVVIGAVALLEARAGAATAAARDVWVFYPLSPGPGRGWTLWAWLALSLAGLVVQLSTGKEGRTSVRRRRR
jgi:hypothetical protein